jgi:hypothetical protein
MTPPSPNDPAAHAASPGTLTIEGKLFGRGNKNLFPNFRMPLPPAWHGTAVTLRTLLDGVVRTEVAAFRERQEARTVLQALSAARIAEGVARGKVDSGGTPDAAQEVNADDAVRTALQAFQDGLYFVFVNDEQKASLDDAFSVGPETRVTFLRLVAMAGG